MRISALAIAACAACGGPQQQQQQEQPPPGAPVINQFTISRESLPYGGGDVTLNWSVSGATAISIDHGVGTVLALGPKTVAVTATTTFTLTATSAGGTVTAAVTVAVATTVSISGHVLWPSSREAAPNAAVEVIGKGVVAADSSGNFTFDGAAPPYDIAAVAPGGGAAVVFQGVTTTSPWLSLYGVNQDPGSYSTHVEGTVDGGMPIDDTHRTVVGFLSSHGSATTAPNADGTWTEYLYWSGVQYVHGAMVAVEYTCASGSALPDGGTLPDCTQPASYVGLAVSDGHGFANGGTYLAGDLPLAPVGTATASGIASAASGYSLSYVSAALLARGGELDLATSHGGSFQFKLPTPAANSGVAVAVGARATSSAGESSDGIVLGAAGMSNISLMLPAAPVLVTPVAGGTLSPSTQFRWNGNASFYLLTIAGPGYHLSVFTRQTFTMLPDLTAVGISPPAASTFAWNVVGYTPSQKTDLPPMDDQLPTLAAGYAALSANGTFKTP